MSSKTQFTILTDRSHGGASLKDGSLELMVRPCVTVCVCLSYFVLSPLSVYVTGYVPMFIILSVSLFHYVHTFMHVRMLVLSSRPACVSVVV